MKRLEDMTEPELARLMRSCAVAVESVAEGLQVERPLFVLVLFNDPKVGQYISNVSREGAVAAMRETADRLERREDVPR